MFAFILDVFHVCIVRCCVCQLSLNKYNYDVDDDNDIVKRL